MAKRKAKAGSVIPAQSHAPARTSQSGPDAQLGPHQPVPVVGSDATVREASPGMTWAKLLVGVGLLLIPVFMYYRVVYQNAVNLPFEDDFDSALNFMSVYLYQTPSFLDKIRLIFSQHNEHRIVVDRLAFLADYYLSGHLNFRHVILLGNVSLIFIAGLLFRSSLVHLPLADRVLYFLPVAFGLFQLHFWELTVWGMASIQNLYVVVFALLCFYALSQSPYSRWWFLMACLAGVTAVFTSGNGLFALLVGLPVLLLLKQYKKLGVWTVLTVLTIGLYFWGYTKPAHHPDIYDSLMHKTEQAKDYFFTLTGSVFAAHYTYPARAGKAFLVLFLLLVGWSVARKTWTANVPVLALLVFTFITCLSLMATRSGFGVSQATSPRYGILSVTLFTGLYLFLIETVRQRYARPVLGVLFLVVSLYLFRDSYAQRLANVEDRALLLRYSSAFYHDNRNNLLLYWSNAERAKQIFNDALHKGFYQLPSITFEQLKSIPQPIDAGRLAATDDVTADVKPYTTHDYLVIFQAWAVRNGATSEGTRIQIIAQSSSHAYAFETGQNMRYDIANQFGSLQYARSGFSCVIHKPDLQPGHYTLWLHLSNGRAQSYLPLNSTFDV